MGVERGHSERTVGGYSYGMFAGATDAGLCDVRDNVRLWGLQREIDCHTELSAMEVHNDKTPIEISNIVLAEWVPMKAMNRQ